MNFTQPNYFLLGQSKLLTFYIFEKTSQAKFKLILNNLVNFRKIYY